MKRKKDVNGNAPVFASPYLFIVRVAGPIEVPEWRKYGRISVPIQTLVAKKGFPE
ncbi:MAG: hypothetical protein AAGI27_08335 [Pseudomonadota bacterium]